MAKGQAVDQRIVEMKFDNADFECLVDYDPIFDTIRHSDGVCGLLCYYWSGVTKLVGVFADPVSADTSWYDGHGTGYHHIQYDDKVQRFVCTGWIRCFAMDVCDSDSISVISVRYSVQ